MASPAPETDDRHPAAVVTAMIDHVLDLAEIEARLTVAA
jgi:hypothetical protein